MTIDLNTLEVGDEVEFKCGTSETIESIVHDENTILINFVSPLSCVKDAFYSKLTGFRVNGNDYFDIVKIKKKQSEKKQEFVVDEVGWYETEDGDKYNVIHKLDGGQLIAVNEKNLDPFIVNEIGNHADYDIRFTLIKYLGPELPKEPFKLSFKAEILSRTRQVLQDKLVEYINLKSSLLWSNTIIFDKPYKFTMEEIVDDKNI